MGYDEDLTSLEEGLRRLKIEYHIFFSGHRKNPPDELRLRVEKQIKKLSECSDMSFSQRFRFTTLITRFYVYRDLWRRTLLEKEMGTKGDPDYQAGSYSTRDRSAPKMVQMSISDPDIEQEKIKKLYQALVGMWAATARQTNLTYDQFAKYIAARTQNIRQKYLCPAVTFMIALEEDTVRFTASADNSLGP